MTLSFADPLPPNFPLSVKFCCYFFGGSPNALKHMNQVPLSYPRILEILFPTLLYSLLFMASSPGHYYGTQEPTLSTEPIKRLFDPQ